MARSYDNYYSGRSYDELGDGHRDYDRLTSGGVNPYTGSITSLEFDYGDPYDSGYRRERRAYRSRADYDSYPGGRAYRSRETAWGYYRNYSRDQVVLRSRQERPRALSRAAGRP